MLKLAMSFVGLPPATKTKLNLQNGIVPRWRKIMNRICTHIVRKKEDDEARSRSRTQSEWDCQAQNICNMLAIPPDYMHERRVTSLTEMTSSSGAAFISFRGFAAPHNSIIFAKETAEQRRRQRLDAILFNYIPSSAFAIYTWQWRTRRMNEENVLRLPFIRGKSLIYAFVGRLSSR